MRETVLETRIKAQGGWKFDAIPEREGGLLEGVVPVPRYAVVPRMSLNQMTTYHWSFDDDVNAYRSASINAIGVLRQKLTDFGEERGADLLRESGLAVSSLSYAGGFTGSDGASFREAVDEAIEAVELAAELRASCLVLISGSRGGHTENHARRLLCDALREIGDAAGERNLHLAIQPMHRSFAGNLTFLTSLEATLDVLTRCSHPRVGMLFDVFHLCQEPNLCQRAVEAARWIKLVALSDWRQTPRYETDRCLPGHGMFAVSKFVQALGAAGYRGYYDIQIQSEECWNSDYVQVINHCQEFFKSPCLLSPQPEGAASPV